MRELKFRAWDKLEKEFAQNIDCLLDMRTPERVFALDDENGELIIEQYTGLKDSNGKEIYEGDILGGIWEGCYIDRCDKCKQYQVFTTFGCMACSGDVQWYEIANDNDLEVIGNIHENPELLEE